MSNPKDKSFKKLQDKWYAKLKKSGFKDIEHDEDTLTEYSSVYFKKHTYDEMVEKQRYHDMANSFLEQYKFETEKDKLIWDYHTNGLSVRDIADLLKKVKLRANRNSVAQDIRRLKAKMFDMLWAPLKEYHEGSDE
jgi:hypothetical protein